MTDRESCGRCAWQTLPSRLPHACSCTQLGRGDPSGRFQSPEATQTLAAGTGTAACAIRRAQLLAVEPPLMLCGIGRRAGGTGSAALRLALGLGRAQLHVGHRRLCPPRPGRPPSRPALRPVGRVIDSVGHHGRGPAVRLAGLHPGPRGRGARDGCRGGGLPLPGREGPTDRAGGQGHRLGHHDWVRRRGGPRGADFPDLCRGRLDPR